MDYIITPQCKYFLKELVPPVKRNHKFQHSRNLNISFLISWKTSFNQHVKEILKKINKKQKYLNLFRQTLNKNQLSYDQRKEENKKHQCSQNALLFLRPDLLVWNSSQFSLNWSIHPKPLKYFFCNYCQFTKRQVIKKWCSFFSSSQRVLC